jgi:hypothetical protein
MFTFQELALVTCVCAASTRLTAAEPAKSVDAQAHSTVISVIGVEVCQDTLQCRYNIRDNSAHDIWLCEAMEIGYADFETVWGKDKQTFVIRKRTDIKWEVARDTPVARYVRLQAGTGRTETLLLPLPLRARGVVSSEGVPPDIGCVTRVRLEMGYYEGDLPRMIRDNLEATGRKQGGTGIPPILRFNECAEGYGDSTDEVFFIVDPLFPVIKGERILLALVDGQRIPIAGSDERRSRAPNLERCSRLEIACEPSILDYCLPYQDQRSLLDSTEIQNLRSLSAVVVNDSEEVKEFARQVSRGVNHGICVGDAKAHVVGYEDSERVAMLDVYDDSFVNGLGEPFACPEAFMDFYFQTFRGLSRQARPFMLRVACARHLTYLYDRFRLYPKAEPWRSVRSHEDTKTGHSVRIASGYPKPTEWCDSVIDAYRGIGMYDKQVNEPLRCPGAGEGRCHYAMNPNCASGSSPHDMVLLFETKPGWNQHGGPELFTFGNHDPKGGLVLLNDGTVKFIRTEEELKQLRWK